jgi:hypothetical protein
MPKTLVKSKTDSRSAAAAAAPPTKKGKGKKADSDDEAYQQKPTKQEKDNKKDPNHPKRPMSSYFLFMNAKRDPLKAAEPDLKFGELTKKLTEQWKSLTDKQREEWDNAALKDKERYAKECQERGILKKGEKPPGEDGKPKRPTGAFFLYQNEMRDKIKKEHPELKH